MATTTTKLYVPEGCYLVCDEGMTSRELIVTHQSTVFVKDHNKLAGTELDKMQDNHNCAKMVILGAIVGVAIAAIICTAVVLSGGTLAIGLGSALAIGAASGAATGFLAGFIPCICAFLTDDYWIKTHPTVRYQGLKPLLQDSELPCWMGGGTVRIVYSKEMADAKDRAKRIETVLGVAAIILSSYTLGKSISSLSSVPSAVRGIFTQFGWQGIRQYVTNFAIRGIASYGTNVGYNWLKENVKFNGHTVDDYVSGKATNTAEAPFKFISGDVYGIPKEIALLTGEWSSIAPSDAVEDQIKTVTSAVEGGLVNSVGDGVSVYSHVTQEEITIIMKQDGYLVDNMGNVYPPDTPYSEIKKRVLISNKDPKAVLGKNIAIEEKTTRIVTNRPGGEQQTILTNRSEHGAQYNFLSKPIMYSIRLVKDNLIDTLKSIGKDAVLITLHQVTAYMNKGIEEAQPAEDKARQGVKVHENTI